MLELALLKVLSATSRRSLAISCFLNAPFRGRLKSRCIRIGVSIDEELSPVLLESSAIFGPNLSSNSFSLRAFKTLFNLKYYKEVATNAKRNTLEGTCRFPLISLTLLTFR